MGTKSSMKIFYVLSRSSRRRRKFSVIVGNPPFIRYQNFDEKYRTIAFDLMNKHGFHPSRLTNIWLPFLLLSCEALSDDGRIGMVIPAELFQVDYAAEARDYLSSHFDSLTLVTFKKLVFDDIQQEVVLLLGEKTSSQKGIRVVELDDLDDLIQNGLSGLYKAETKDLDHSSDKWVNTTYPTKNYGFAYVDSDDGFQTQPIYTKSMLAWSAERMTFSVKLGECS